MKKINTYIYNYYLKPKHITLPFIYTYLKKKNPIIETEINGQLVKFPFNHMLPVYQMKYEKYDRQIAQICKIIFDKIGKLNMIDIGANIGDTIINIGLARGGVFGY